MKQDSLLNKEELARFNALTVKSAQVSPKVP